MEFGGRGALCYSRGAPSDHTCVCGNELARELGGRDLSQVPGETKPLELVAPAPDLGVERAQGMN